MSIEEWDTVTTGFGDSSALDEAGDEPEAELYFDSLPDFVTGFLRLGYARYLSTHRVWCPEWWRHAEAIARLEALWRAWEHLRLEPATGMSVWYRDHADPHMAALLDESGPFKGCGPTKGHQPATGPLPLTDPPDGAFSPQAYEQGSTPRTAAVSADV